METFFKEARKKIALTFLFIGIPAAFLFVGGLVLTSFDNVFLGVVAIIAGSALFMFYSVRAGQIETRIAQQVTLNSPKNKLLPS